MNSSVLLVRTGQIAQAILSAAESLDWTVYSAEAGPRALGIAEHLRPAAIVLDARDQLERCVDFCKALRAVDDLADTHLIAITGAGGEADQLALLESGSDDCWDEPDDERNLLLRMRAIHRRLKSRRAKRTIRHGPVELDLDGYSVRTDGLPVQLSAIQLKLLQHFMENPGVVYSCKDLLEQVWGKPHIDDGAVRACIVRVRRILEAAGAPSMIKSVHVPGGYMLDAGTTVAEI